MDLSRIEPLLPPGTIDQVPIEMVRIYKYLSVHSDNQLKSPTNVNAVELLSGKISVD